ncbi:MAG: hypothetical protein HQL51_03880 [Magnetococcales bacterium]|nr:hypothetical protein [Magnetococcales bacterium]
METITPVVVAFGGASLAPPSLSIEVDARPDGPNAGKTQFLPGESAGLLIHASPGVCLRGLRSTAGAVSLGGAVRYQREEEVIFADADSATLPVPALALDSVKWLGAKLGGLTLQADGVTVRAEAGKIFGVAKVVFTVEAWTATLALPESLDGEVEFSIPIQVTGETA